MRPANERTAAPSPRTVSAPSIQLVAWLYTIGAVALVVAIWALI